MTNNTAGTTDKKRLAPWIPTPIKIIAMALALADISPEDTVVDIGCGDGRVPIIAAKYFHAKVTCIEITEELCALALANAKYNNVENQFYLECIDAREANYSPYTIIYLYMYRSVNKLLAEKLNTETKKGTRIVTIDFPIPEWIPVTIRRTLDENNIERTIYLYITGLSNPASWRPRKFEGYPEKNPWSQRKK